MDASAMGTTATYAWISLVLSLASLALSLVYLKRSAHAYRRWHDDRAAVTLGKAVGLVVMALGLTISALGLVVVPQGAILATAGLSLARGALLALVATLVLAGVRPGSE